MRDPGRAGGEFGGGVGDGSGGFTCVGGGGIPGGGVGCGVPDPVPGNPGKGLMRIPPGVLGNGAEIGRAPVHSFTMCWSSTGLAHRVERFAIGGQVIHSACAIGGQVIHSACAIEGQVIRSAGHPFSMRGSSIWPAYRVKRARRAKAKRRSSVRSRDGTDRGTGHPFGYRKDWARAPGRAVRDRGTGHPFG
jgi:hypothetical protein